MMLRKIITTVAVTLINQPLQAQASGGALNLLMVGNTFSKAHNMEEMIQTMLNERRMMLQADTIFAARFEEVGANLTHYANAPGLAKMIRELSWTWIVLQEQSETPGYCESKPEWQGAWNASLASVLQLNIMIQMNGATTVLFETWGYFDRDPYNENFFPDYNTMQQKITHGYNTYHDQVLLYNPAAKVKVAPAGLAFQRIYNSIKENGEDPHAVDSLFEKLYMTLEEYTPSDGNIARKYPTLEGSYLCGCVLFQTLTGLDVRQSTYTPTGMDIQMRKILQNVAYDTVVSAQNDNPDSDPKPSSYEYKTRAPYVPDQQRDHGGRGSTSPTLSWLLFVVLIGVGVAFFLIRAGKRQQATRVVPSSRDYGWNPVAHDDVAMELTDIPCGGPNHLFT
jgi:hypothetical protein